VLEERLIAVLNRSELGQELTDLVAVALTHSSYAYETEIDDEDNERLEFLGDAVLGLCVADLLYARCRELAPGDLTRIRAVLVSGDSLAAVARDWGFGQALQLGRGEEQGGGRTRPSNLSRAFEAVIAAVYLSDGYVAARRLVAAALDPGFTAAIEGAFAQDTKSALQEYAQARGQVPAYEVLARDGPEHAPTWRVRVSLGDLAAEAAAGSRRQAEKDAACRLLQALVPPADR